MNKRPFIYLLSHSYSGSTLLTFLMAMHPEIATIGELKATSMGDINTYRCSCGELLTKCGFWQAVVQETARRKIEFSLDNFNTHFRAEDLVCDKAMKAAIRNSFWEGVRKILLNYFWPCRKKFNKIMCSNLELIDIVCKLQKAKFFLDGSKDATRLKFFLQEDSLDVKILFLLRAPMGAINSYINHNKVGLEVAIDEWLRRSKEIIYLLSRVPANQFLGISYENLCQRPNEVMGGIFEFLQLPKLDSALNFRSVEHHILGNAMRLKNSSEIKLDEKWKKQMSECDINFCKQAVGYMANNLHKFMQKF